MPDLTGRYSLQEQIHCVAREVESRRRMYRNWVRDGTMDHHTAAAEIGCMEQALRTLQSLEPKP